jgi:8-oxo-dGTP pyrophosphatase MutT (NUDIX family)
MYGKIVVGAMILRNLKILLLERLSHEIYEPNVFELPSGNVDSTDPNLAHALTREVGEEAGLKVPRSGRAFAVF